MGITQKLVGILSDRFEGTKVTRVVLEIGKLSPVLPAAIRFCFDLCSVGTALEGALLEIIETPGRALCRRCRAEITMERPFVRCICGNTDLEWLSGEELTIKEMELA